LTGEQALRQLFNQRQAKHRVQVSAANTRLKIGQDALDFSVQSNRAGYVYVALAGSDNKSVYLLFPNDLDQNNKIEAGQTLQLPRPNWRVKAAGPVGTDNLLVMVTAAPRDLTALGATKAGPFVASLNDAQGRAKMGALMTTSSGVTTPTCQSPAARRNNPMCSDAYGAAMLTIEEMP
jgi:fructosamine-3-kinase